MLSSFKLLLQYHSEASAYLIPVQSSLLPTATEKFVFMLRRIWCNSSDQGGIFTVAMTAMAVVAPRSGRYAPQIIVRPTATMAFGPLTLLKSRSCFKSVRTWSGFWTALCCVQNGRDANIRIALTAGVSPRLSAVFTPVIQTGRAGEGAGLISM